MVSRREPGTRWAWQTRNSPILRLYWAAPIATPPGAGPSELRTQRAPAPGPSLSARLEVQRRLLGNGYCNRPTELDCGFETVCETCVHFGIGAEFVPVFARQRDHAAERHQQALVSVYDGLLKRIEQDVKAEPGYAGDGPDLTGSPA